MFKFLRDYKKKSDAFEAEKRRQEDIDIRRANAWWEYTIAIAPEDDSLEDWCHGWRWKWQGTDNIYYLTDAKGLAKMIRQARDRQARGEVQENLKEFTRDFDYKA